jgi:hypothetical protein
VANTLEPVPVAVAPPLKKTSHPDGVVDAETFAIISITCPDFNVATRPPAEAFTVTSPVLAFQITHVCPFAAPDGKVIVCVSVPVIFCK